jgi:hypothetical protein
MTGRECKQTILKILNAALLNALRADRRATAAHAAAGAGYGAWHEAHPDDGVGSISGCPYNVTHAELAMNLARADYKRMQETYQFAINSLID